MFIVDFSQVCISNLMMQLGNHVNAKLEEDLLRHMILNSIRSYNVKHKADFGEMIIACDDQNYWRKDVFPYYKANRKKNRDASEIDWNSVFETLNKVREELKEFFPYRVIQVDKAEADDIIGVLCKEFGNTPEKILILSGDGDFKQLQSYMNVTQYDPVKKKKIVENNPERYLKQHIMKGDVGDGIPNFLSDDNSLVVGTRQKSIMQKKLDYWLTQQPENFCDEKMLRGYRRNEQLIDLDKIPDNLRANIVDEYVSQSGKKNNRKHLFNYFIKHKLKHLMGELQDF